MLGFVALLPFAFGIAITPLVVGHNECFVVPYWLKSEDVKTILPAGMELPSADQAMDFMGEAPGSDTFANGQLTVTPIAISFCNGTDIHDIYTKWNVPQQEEIMILVPVLFNGQIHTFVPTLFLNSWVGVAGGLVFGLRKQHKDMDIQDSHSGNATKQSIHIDKLLDVAFTSNGESTPLPAYVHNVFQVYPFITNSYRNKIVCYASEMTVEYVHTASVETNFSWTSLDIENLNSKGVRLAYSFALGSTFDCNEAPSTVPTVPVPPFFIEMMI